MTGVGQDTICYEAHGNLYLNITNRCTAECTFCIRNMQNGVYGYDLCLSREPEAAEIIEELQEHHLPDFREVVFTGFGEPTLRPEVLLTVTQWLKAHNAYVRLDTNGHAQLINPETDVVTVLRQAGLDAVSISLNAESAEKYLELCKPVFPEAYSALLEFTRKAVEAGLDTRMTVVRVPGIDIEKCKQIARSLGADFHVRG
jgi:TatD family-associated radical SAM protein